MCLCTQYDSPTCGHSWISMTEPCGFLHDLLNCPNRQTVWTSIAPAMTCPQCNRAFADPETIQMVQGPWGCNQMIRNQIGGNFAIPGQWGNAQVLPMGAQPMMMGDHRLTGPYGNRPFGPQLMIGSGDCCDDGYVYDDGFGFGCCDDGRRRRSSSSHHYREYRRSTRPANACVVM